MRKRLDLMLTVYVVGFLVYWTFWRDSRFSAIVLGMYVMHYFSVWMESKE